MRRVASTVWKRLERLEQVKKKRKHIGAWPDIIYDCDAWSAIAEPYLRQLILDTCGGEEPAPTPRKAALAFDPEQYQVVHTIPPTAPTQR